MRTTAFSLPTFIALAALSCSNRDQDSDDNHPADAGHHEGSLTCADPTLIAAGTTMQGSLAGRSKLSVTSGSCRQAKGPEHVYAAHLDHTADLLWLVTPTGPTHDVVAYVQTGCNATDVLACADEAPGASSEMVVVENAAPGDYLLVVDGYYEDDSGGYQATLQWREIVAANAPCDVHRMNNRCATGLFCHPVNHTCVSATTETEPNDTLSQAQSLDLPAVVTGTCSAPLEMDRFNVDLTAGDVLVAEALAGTTSQCGDPDTDSRITLSLTDGTYVDADDNSGSGDCALLATVVQQSGLHQVQLGNGWAHPAAVFDYALRLRTATPVNEDEAEPNGSLQPRSITPPVAISATASAEEDQDVFSMTFTSPVALFAETAGRGDSTCLSLDTLLTLYSADGVTKVTDNNNIWDRPGGCSRIVVELPPGTYYLESMPFPGSVTPFDYLLRVVALPR